MQFVMWEQDGALIVRRNRWERFGIYLGYEEGDWSEVEVEEEYVVIGERSRETFLKFLACEGIRENESYLIKREDGGEDGGM